MGAAPRTPPPWGRQPPGTPGARRALHNPQPFACGRRGGTPRGGHPHLPEPPQGRATHSPQPSTAHGHLGGAPLETGVKGGAPSSQPQAPSKAKGGGGLHPPGTPEERATRDRQEASYAFPPSVPGKFVTEIKIVFARQMPPSEGPGAEDPRGKTRSLNRLPRCVCRQLGCPPSVTRAGGDVWVPAVLGEPVCLRSRPALRCAIRPHPLVPLPVFSPPAF